MLRSVRCVLQTWPASCMLRPTAAWAGQSYGQPTPLGPGQLTSNARSKRGVRAGTGVSAGAELDADAITLGLADREAQQQALAAAAFAAVTAEYLQLEAAITDPVARTGPYCQPWLAR